MAFRLAFAILLASALAGPSPTFAQDCASLAEDPVQTVTAGGVTMQVDVRHIFCGETSSRTRSGGFHSILGFGQPGAPTAILLATPPDVFPPAGSIHFPEGQAKYSSLFPFHCGFEETLASILHATVSPQRDIREGGDRNVVDGPSAPQAGAPGFCTLVDGSPFRLRVVVSEDLEGPGQVPGIRTAYPLAS